MKKALMTFILVSAGIILGLVSCDDNSHSLGSFGIDIATVIPEGENAYSLLLDNGKRLWPAASSFRYNPTYNQRVFLNYTVLSEAQNAYDHYIKVILDPNGPIFVILDHNYVVPIGRKIFGNVVTYFSGSDKNDLQNNSAFQNKSNLCSYQLQ